MERNYGFEDKERIIKYNWKKKIGQMCWKLKGITIENTQTEKHEGELEKSRGKNLWKLTQNKWKWWKTDRIKTTTGNSLKQGNAERD